MSSGKEIRDLNKIYLEAVYGQSAGQKLAKREKDDDAAGAPRKATPASRMSSIACSISLRCSPSPSISEDLVYPLGQLVLR